MSPAIHSRRVGIRQGEAGLPGEVPLHPVAVSAGDQELLGGILASHGNGPGLKAEGQKFGGGCGRGAFRFPCRFVDLRFRTAGLCGCQHQREKGQPERRSGRKVVSMVTAGSVHRTL